MSFHGIEYIKIQKVSVARPENVLARPENGNNDISK